MTYESEYHSSILQKMKSANSTPLFTLTKSVNFNINKLLNMTKNKMVFILFLIGTFSSFAQGTCQKYADWMPSGSTHRIAKNICIYRCLNKIKKMNALEPVAKYRFNRMERIQGKNCVTHDHLQSITHQQYYYIISAQKN